MSKLPALSSLNKDQLVEELHSYDVDVKPKWTVPELRELLKEFRRDRHPKIDPLKGLSQKTKGELTEMCQEANIRIPEKATRGLMMLLLREYYEEPPAGSSLINFGEHKGKRYDEVPAKYLEWAAKEETPSKGLRDLLQWHSHQLDKRTEKTQTKSAIAAGPTSGSYVPATPQRSAKRSSASSEASSWEPIQMDQSSSETKARIQELETQLAILKRQQGGASPGNTHSEQ